jgi:hypothetical protein
MPDVDEIMDARHFRSQLSLLFEAEEDRLDGTQAESCEYSQ